MSDDEEMVKLYAENEDKFRVMAHELSELFLDELLKWMEEQPCEQGTDGANMLTALQIFQAQTLACAIWGIWGPMHPENIAEGAGQNFGDLLEDALEILRERRKDKTGPEWIN